MKHLKIVLTLTIVVVLFSGLVFIAESVTTPIIQERLIREANEAKFEVLPTLNDTYDLSYNIPDSSENYDLEGTSVIGVYYEEGFGYIYEAQFQGYQSKIRYMIGINEAGEITGYKTLEQGDTPGLGAEINNSEYWEQFKGMSFNTALNQEFDGISGATVTSTGWKESVAKVVDFHVNTVLGYTYVDVTDSVDVTGVTKAEEVQKDGSVLEVSYTVEFETQYSSAPNRYFVTFKIGQGIKSLEILEANDTDIYGAHIADPEFSEQFTNMSYEAAMGGEYDDLGGATYTVTLEAFTATMDKLLAYHNQAYEGAAPETDEERLLRYKDEISVKNGTFEDVTGDYDLTDTYITKVEMVTADGASDPSYVVLSFTFPGYINDIEALLGIDLAADKISGFRVVSENETDGIGDRILEEEFLSQFDDFSLLGAKYGVYDAIGGSSQTTGTQLTAGFDNVITFYQEAFMGLGNTSELTEAQILQQKITSLFPEQFSLNDVSGDYVLSNDVVKVIEVKDFSGTLLGYAFLAEGVGASYDGPTTIEYLIGIAPDKTFVGFEMLDDSETPGKADPYYLVEYAEQFIGLDIENLDYPIDAVAGSTLTHVKIMDSAERIARFYVETILEQEFAREEPSPVDQAILEAAYPGATTFNSVYMDYAYSDSILNIYEATDGTNVLGYVYIGAATGKGAEPIVFAWGINNSGITQQIEIISHSETWQEVVNCGDYCSPEYDGSDGIFPDTPWLATQFEGIDIANIQTTETIDDISGVSVTTSGLREAAIAIVTYHNDENVGGAN
jgi:electron transport complex protein RnfG